LEQPDYAVFDGHVDYKILSTFDQKPYSALASGVGQSVTHILSSYYLPWEEKNQFEVTFKLQNPFQAKANQTYFLAIHLSEKYPRPSAELFYWAANASGKDVGLPAYYAFPESPGSWQRAESIYWQDYLAFQMMAEAVPEPSTFALLTVGGIGICLHRKRRLN
jgi:PEP-CTERM motif